MFIKANAQVNIYYGSDGSNSRQSRYSLRRNDFNESVDDVVSELRDLADQIEKEHTIS